jgi:hypothetical protein
VAKGVHEVPNGTGISADGGSMRSSQASRLLDNCFLLLRAALRHWSFSSSRYFIGLAGTLPGESAGALMGQSVLPFS